MELSFISILKQQLYYSLPYRFIEVCALAESAVCVSYALKTSESVIDLMRNIGAATKEVTAPMLLFIASVKL